MRHRAVLTGVQISLVVLQRHIAGGHGGHQLVVVGLTLGATDDLTDAGHQQVGGGHGLAVGVLLHVEGLDGGGVVDHEDGTAEMLVGEVLLMLGLEVTAPLHGVLEVLPRGGGGLEDLDGVGVVQLDEIVLQHLVQLLDDTLLHPLVEELHLLGAVVHDVLDDVLDEVLGDLDDVVDIAEADLGLHVPELGHVTGGVGVLGAEGGTEGVDTAQTHGGHLTLQLGGDGQTSLAAKEIVRVVLGLALGGGVPGQGGDAEHLTCALAVGAGDDGGMDVAVAVLVEVLVDGLSQLIADGEDGLEVAGADTEMGDGAQVLQGVTLLLEGVVGGALTQHGQGLYVHLDAVAVGSHDGTRCGEGRAHGHGVAVDALVHLLLVDDQLEAAEAGAVVDLQEGDVLGISGGTHPAADDGGGAHEGLGLGKQLFDVGVFHGMLLQSWNFANRYRLL